MEEKQLINIATTFGTCMLAALDQTMPPHSRKARAISRVEEALIDLASLHAKPMNPEHAELARKAWNAGMQVIIDYTDPQAKQGSTAATT